MIIYKMRYIISLLGWEYGKFADIDLSTFVLVKWVHG